MEFKHNISILGSTGSIGTQTLEVARSYPGIRVHAISAYSNVDLMEAQIREFKPRLACLISEKAASELKVRVADTDTKVVSGQAGLVEAATYPEAEIVVTAVVGISGLLPTIEAIKEGKNIAL